MLGEIRQGIERVKIDDPKHAKAIEKWIATLATSYSDRILPIDLVVAEEWGRMSVKRPVPTIDSLLAATAKVHGLMLVTRNIADVADLGVAVPNPSPLAEGWLWQTTRT